MGHEVPHVPASYGERLGLSTPAQEMDPRIPGDALLTVRDVAEVLRVPVSWVYEHARRRSRPRLPSIKIGKYLRFTASDVRAFLAQVRMSHR